MRETKIVWNASDGNLDKSNTWYWTVGIIAVGVSVAGFILGNLLFGLMALLGGFAIMLAGSQPEKNQKCAVTEKGVHIDKTLIPFHNIKRFAIREDEPRKLVIETAGLMGIVSLPLAEDVDFRNIRSQLKNHNIEEEDNIESFTEKIAEAIGM